MCVSVSVDVLAPVGPPDGLTSSLTWRTPSLGYVGTLAGSVVSGQVKSAWRVARGTLVPAVAILPPEPPAQSCAGSSAASDRGQHCQGSPRPPLPAVPLTLETLPCPFLVTAELPSRSPSVSEVCLRAWPRRGLRRRSRTAGCNRSVQAEHEVIETVSLEGKAASQGDREPCASVSQESGKAFIGGA